MKLAEICELTRESIAALLNQRRRPGSDKGTCRRDAVRSSFPSTVELWVPGQGGGEEYMLATSLNLSERGIGIHSDVELEIGSQIGIAVHELEATLHGKAMVRYCNRAGSGYRVGLEFLFGSQ